MAAMLTAAGASAALAASDAPAKVRATVTVTGEGVIHGVPNLAVLQSAVVTTNADAGAALSQNSAKVRSTLAAFHAAGIADRDIATTDFSITPRYAERKDDDSAPRIVDYTVRNAVTVKIRELDHLGAVLQAAVGSGANDVGALSFTFADPGKLLDEARRKAMADARHRAALYAEAAGMALGPVVRITDNGGVVPRPYAMMRTMAAPKGGVPISRGEREVRARVQAVWSLTTK
jgi:uncharacterized protein YggE